MMEFANVNFPETAPDAAKFAKPADAVIALFTARPDCKSPSKAAVSSYHVFADMRNVTTMADGMKQPRLIPLAGRDRSTDDRVRAHAFAEQMQRRRTVRDFSARAVPRGVIENCLRVAGSAPSGANLQPWHFVAIGDPSVKHEIRVAAASLSKVSFTRASRTG